MNKQSVSKSPKKFSPKEGRKDADPVEAPQPTAPHAKQGKKPAETVAPKLPVKPATKNEALKCLVVSDGSLTYFGTESKEEGRRGEMNWRVIYSQDRVKTMFTKVEAVQTDAALDDATKTKKIAEIFKSYTAPMSRGVQWTHKLESTMAAPVSSVVETPAA